MKCVILTCKSLVVQGVKHTNVRMQAHTNTHTHTHTDPKLKYTDMTMFLFHSKANVLAQSLSAVLVFAPTCINIIT